MFKSLAEINVSDSRFANVVTHDAASGRISAWSIADQHELMRSLELSADVPETVREQFDAARNTFVYAWFDYELHTVAEQYCYVVVEMALKERHKLAALPEPKRRGLAALIRSAVKHGWIQAGNYEIAAPYTAGGSFSMFDFMRMSRNHILHGNRHLNPWGSRDAMEWCAQFINEMFGSSTV